MKVFECERLSGSVETRHPKRIDWRHMLPSLKRKPGAFARWVLRDAMFPRSEYAQTWERLRERLERARGLPDDGRVARAGRPGQCRRRTGRRAGGAESSAMPCPTSSNCASAFAPRAASDAERAGGAARRPAVYDELLEAA